MSQSNATENQTHTAESKAFLTTQIITYLGNKRALLGNIEREVEAIHRELGKEKLVCADLFSGSGIVARMMKRHASLLIANDLETYSRVINSCYLANKADYPADTCASLRAEIERQCAERKRSGIITAHYAPADDGNIRPGERAFYTHENALRIDTYRTLIDEIVTDERLKRFFLAPLITEASVHVNTSGVFKGFYKDKRTGIGCFGAAGKNALTRICGNITLKEPVLSNFSARLALHQEDAVALATELRGIDVAYIDPPYNQHPYGSNYFMLNLILKNRLDVAVSPVSGITQDWNRSAFNSPRTALSALEEIIASLDTAYALVSYNSEGFIAFADMVAMLRKYGTVRAAEIPYTAFRGSRNLGERPLHVSEYLFVLRKKQPSHVRTK